MHYTKIFIIFFFCFISCIKPDKQKNLKNKENPLIGKVITLNSTYPISETLSQEKCNRKYKLIVIFDGECSGCIINFLEFISNYKNTIKNWNCLFISFSQDIFEIKYYMEKNNIKLTECHDLLADSNLSFFESNPFIKSNNNIFILNNSNKIINQINFFHHKEEDTIEILNNYNH